MIRSIRYGADAIQYRKFDATTSTLGAWTPRSTNCGWMEWDAKSKVLTVHATANKVVIRR